MNRLKKHRGKEKSSGREAKSELINCLPSSYSDKIWVGVAGGDIMNAVG